MKKKIYLYILICLILIILSSFLSIIIYKNYNKNIDIQISNQVWNNYDESINIIKNNMDKITEPNENFNWWVLKDFDISDNEYELTLDRMVTDIRRCYLEYTDDGTLYTNTNPIRKYREKKFITKEELNELNYIMHHEIRFGCLNNFYANNSLLISYDESLRNKVLNETNKIVQIQTSEIFTNQNATYNELLLRKMIEVHYIADLSEFLVEEYNRLK